MKLSKKDYSFLLKEFQNIDDFLITKNEKYLNDDIEFDPEIFINFIVDKQKEEELNATVHEFKIDIEQCDLSCDFYVYTKKVKSVLSCHDDSYFLKSYLASLILKDNKKETLSFAKKTLNRLFNAYAESDFVVSPKVSIFASILLTTLDLKSLNLIRFFDYDNFINENASLKNMLITSCNNFYDSGVNINKNELNLSFFDHNNNFFINPYYMNILKENNNLFVYFEDFDKTSSKIYNYEIRYKKINDSFGLFVFYSFFNGKQYSSKFETEYIQDLNIYLKKLDVEDFSSFSLEID